MNSARNDVLMDGLDDWVHFYRVHRLVYLANPDASVGELQVESLNTVADLVSAGLYPSRHRRTRRRLRPVGHSHR